MVVCHCRAVSVRTIAATLASGASSVEQVGLDCGAGTRCGGCRPVIEALLLLEQEARTTTTA
jgi:bacterioferritin-associated ferredoxin